MRTIVDKVFDMLYKYQEEQLHFFWAFSVTTLAVFWQPLLAVSYTHLTLPTNREV